MNYNKHFESFINNDATVRKYFNVKIGELKKNYKHLFKAAKVGNNGILLKTGKTEEENIKIMNEAREILRNYYVFNNLGVKEDGLINNQGKTINDKFKILDQYENIMMDMGLKVNERVNKIKELCKTDLTNRQIEQYIYRNYSSYKYVKPMVETSEKESTEKDSLEKEEEKTKKSYYVKRPLKFNILLKDNNIMDDIKKNDNVKELVNEIKNKYDNLPFDNTQLVNFIYRQKRQNL